MRARLAITDGRRALLPVSDVARSTLAIDDADAFEAAYGVLARVLSLERHQANFLAVRAGDPPIVTFRVSRELSAPAGFRWARAEDVPADAKADILACAAVLGFSRAGVTTPVLPERYLDRFDAWLASGAHAGMDFLARKAAPRRDPALVLPGAQSVIALATAYAADDASDPRARIARYAQSRDYHEVIEKRLHVLKAFIERTFSARCYNSVDTGPVLERAYAERAGLGWIGKNGLLISRTQGSYAFLATLWTTLALAPDAQHDEHCGTCDACLTGCPTRAITAPGFVDARRCISYWTIEHEGALDDAPPSHGWLFGCDVCQEVCPWNRFAGSPTMAELATKRTLTVDVAHASDGEIDAAIAGTPLRRAGAAGLRRNVRRILPIVE
ncbi:MAG: tRNA epoxyqueuosine(34) reductase QueG [Deltaproteobacteria bacterium]|nr:tRNA epoxyqueuosine(34) reductase QueG [Deltaproteobacteria bacterium]